MTTFDDGTSDFPKRRTSVPVDDRLETTDLRRLLVSVPALLERAGWRRVGTKHRSDVWMDPRRENSVFLAQTSSLGGALSSIREAIHQIASTTGQSYLEVAYEAREPWYDHLLIRTQIDSDLSTVLLTQAADKIEALRSLLLSAARAATFKAAVYKAQDQPVSRSYSHDARLAPFGSGSFIFHGLVPITHLDQEPLFQDRASLGSLRDSDHTKATRTLVEALSAASVAAVDGRTNAFEAAIESGVSANLLEALTDLAVDDEDQPAPIEVRLRYTHDIDVADPAAARFDRNGMLAIVRAANTLRSDEPPITARVIGTVTNLKRRSRRGPGEASIRGQTGQLDGVRSFRLALDERAYDSLATIHADHLLADVLCTFRVTGRNRIQVLDIDDIRAVD